MDLLQHGVDRSVIAMWLGHEPNVTVNVTGCDGSKTLAGLSRRGRCPEGELVAMARRRRMVEKGPVFWAFVKNTYLTRRHPARVSVNVCRGFVV